MRSHAKYFMRNFLGNFLCALLAWTALHGKDRYVVCAVFLQVKHDEVFFIVDIGQRTKLIAVGGSEASA